MPLVYCSEPSKGGRRQLPIGRNIRSRTRSRARELSPRAQKISPFSNTYPLFGGNPWDEGIFVKRPDKNRGTTYHAFQAIKVVARTLVARIGPITTTATSRAGLRFSTFLLIGEIWEVNLRPYMQATANPVATF